MKKKKRLTILCIAFLSSGYLVMEDKPGTLSGMKKNTLKRKALNNERIKGNDPKVKIIDKKRDIIGKPRGSDIPPSKLYFKVLKKVNSIKAENIKCKIELKSFTQYLLMRKAHKRDNLSKSESFKIISKSMGVSAESGKLMDEVRAINGSSEGVLPTLSSLKRLPSDELLRLSDEIQKSFFCTKLSELDLVLAIFHRQYHTFFKSEKTRNLFLKEIFRIIKHELQYNYHPYTTIRSIDAIKLYSNQKDIPDINYNAENILNEILMEAEGSYRIFKIKESDLEVNEFISYLIRTEDLNRQVMEVLDKFYPDL